MVLGVCRRRLGRSPDADDAFQVVFIVLARDARKIENRESLAGWLYRVADLVALKWAGKVHRRAPGELLVDAVSDPRPGPEADTVELPVLSLDSRGPRETRRRFRPEF
jgi:DNA-directed RNA polymerase specialized sigma24 family protein